MNYRESFLVDLLIDERNIWVGSQFFKRINYYTFFNDNGEQLCIHCTNNTFVYKLFLIIQLF